MPIRTRRKLAVEMGERLERLAAISSELPKLTRLFLSKEHLAAAKLVRRWMKDAGMSAAIDAAGNVVGRYEGDKAGGRTLLIGSHIDTVRDAGKFSGPIGVLVAIEAVSRLNRLKRRLGFSIEVIAFGDEVAHRFVSQSPGSRAIAGQIDAAMLAAKDAAGITLQRALEDFGGDPHALGGLARNASNLIGFLEVYPEQGPMLEAEGVGLGVVTSVAGITRLSVTVTGATGQTCTLPFAQRRDALVTAAEMVLATEIVCRQVAGLVATVGTMAVTPDRVECIPATAVLQVEMRSNVDRVRRMGQRDLERTLKSIARRRRCDVRIEPVLEVPASECDQRFTTQLAKSVERCGGRGFLMPLGIGNGATSLARLCPVGMLALRCRGGVANDPSEYVKPEDIETAIKVLLDFLGNLDMIGAR